MGLPNGLHIRKTGHNPPRGPSGLVGATEYKCSQDQLLSVLLSYSPATGHSPWQNSHDMNVKTLRLKIF
jgi:hypothetical protein